uniref:Uncharacterized protein n=1 Tax=Romanomermis culicivorax TaxID=13658 RepID=A0A915HZ88_ROMCU
MTISVSAFRFSKPRFRFSCFILWLLKLKDEMDKQGSLSHFVVQEKLDDADQRFEEIDVAMVQLM